MIEAIVALDDKGGAGLNNRLPWPHNSEDMRWFQQITANKVCVVGFNTAKTLPELKGRKVIVMHRDEKPEDLIEVYKDLVVIGGPTTYRQWLPFIDRFYIARIKGEYPADTYLKEWALWT